jgi:hypothetical protein
VRYAWSGRGSSTRTQLAEPADSNARDRAAVIASLIR